MQIIISDVKRGIAASKYRYAIALLLFFSVMILSEMSIQKEFSVQGVDVELGFIDYLILVFCGITKYIPEQGKEFRLPVIWLSVQFMTALIVYDYANRDVKGIGQNILIRCKKKTDWWYSKCIWCAVSVSLVYCMIIGIAAALSFVLGSGAMGSDSRVFERLLGIPYSERSFGQVVVFLFIMPFFTSLALSYIQLCVSQILEPMLAMMTMMVIVFLSSYYMTHVLIGNYSMLLRSDFVLQGGMHMKTGILVDLIVSAAAIMAGRSVFLKKDVLGKME